MEWFVKVIALAAIVLFAFAMAGCARFAVTQTDESPDERIITTKISGVTWFTSAQSISNLKAQQTDKTQSFNTAAIGQHGDTNTVAMLDALAKLLQAVKP